MKNLTTPTYSPDGSRIAFAGWVEGNGFEIYEYDIVKNCCRRLIASSGREDQAPSYAADGNRIAFMSDRLGQPHIYIGDTNGGRATLLSPFVSGMRGYYFSPDWAPNSSKIVFSGHWNSRGVYQIMVADATSTNLGNNDGWVFFGDTPPAVSDFEAYGEAQIAVKWTAPAGGKVEMFGRSGATAHLGELIR